LISICIFLCRRVRGLCRSRRLHRVAHQNETALGTGHRALQHQQPTLGIHRRHLEVQGGHPLLPEMSGHFLVLEGFARILTIAGRAVRAMADRHAVACLQAAEVPALHGAGKPLAFRGPDHVNLLPDQEVRRRQRRPRLQHRVRGYSELGQLRLRLDLRTSEVSLVRLRHVLHLGLPPTELNGGITIRLLGTRGHHL
jgi:hypothetical protein